MPGEKRRQQFMRGLGFINDFALLHGRRSYRILP